MAAAGVRPEWMCSLGSNASRHGLPLARRAAGAAVAVAAIAAVTVPHAATAQTAPDAGPAFTQPLVITNPFRPVVPGTVNVYTGIDRRDHVVVVESHLAETRDFAWEGTVVPCRVVESLTFRDGAPTGRDRLFLAQSDDGAVWAFGDLDEEDDDEDDGPDEGDGWIVGERSAGDPPGVVTGAAPSVHMPAAPRRGDRWLPENVPPAFVTSSRAVGLGGRVRVGQGAHGDCLRVVEEDALDPRPDVKWFAPGVGLVRKRGPGERIALTASTLRAGASPKRR